MMEESSLALLANVALNDQANVTAIEEIRKRRDFRALRATILKVTTINGEDYTHVTDLMRVSQNDLLQIFVDKSDDRKSHNSVYTCKYELNNCCNMRFCDTKDHRTNRVEHLLYLHLISHFLKTRIGTLIKLPQVFHKSEKCIPIIEKPKSIVSLKPKLVYEEVDWTPEEKNMKDSIVIDLLRESPGPELKMVTNESIPVHIKTKENAPQHSVLHRVKCDHPYSNSNELTLNNPVSSSNPPIIPVEYQCLDVEKLYYLNGESSQELNTFMIHEALNQAVSIVTVEEKSTIEELPVVGCEAEVRTEKQAFNEPVISAEIDSVSEEYFPCTKCDIVFSSKSVLAAHMKHKHSERNLIKTNRRLRMNRNSNVELKTAKRKFDGALYRNAALYDVVKENLEDSKPKRIKKTDKSILKTALLKESNTKPKISISNLWNSINVQYV